MASPNITYIRLLQAIESFSRAHMQVRRFGSDFEGQLPNFATEEESYPIIFVSPRPGAMRSNVNTMSVIIKCFDIIQKDRANINTILSDTHSILSDLEIWFRDGQTGIDLSIDPVINPLNNALLDYAAGWEMEIVFDVFKSSFCAIPFDGSPEVISEVNDIVYSRYLTCETLDDCPLIQDLILEDIYLQEQIDAIVGLTGSLTCDNLEDCLVIQEIEADIQGAYSEIQTLYNNDFNIFQEITGITTSLVSITQSIIDLQLEDINLQDQIDNISTSTNLGYIGSTQSGIITSDTGTDATIPPSSSTQSGLMITDDKDKLDSLFLPTGLEKIGVGWRLIGKDPTRYLTLGSNAVDLSNNTSMFVPSGPSGARAFTIGNRTIANGSDSMAMGFNSQASGSKSFAGGEQSTTGGDNSIAFGYRCVGNGDSSVAMGFQSDANGSNSIAMGEDAEANGQSSLAFNSGIANGNFGAAMGYGNTSEAQSEVVIGEFAEEVPGTPDLTIDTDTVFRVGIGYQDELFDVIRRDGLQVYKNGMIRISPATQSSVINGTTASIIYNKATNHLNLHNGSTWKEIAITDDIYSGITSSILGGFTSSGNIDMIGYTKHFGVAPTVADIGSKGIAFGTIGSLANGVTGFQNMFSTYANGSAGPNNIIGCQISGATGVAHINFSAVKSSAYDTFNDANRLLFSFRDGYLAPVPKLEIGTDFIRISSYTSSRVDSTTPVNFLYTDINGKLLSKPLTTIVGTTGPTGPAGTNGTIGVNGATGATGATGPSVWGGITGTLSTQTDLQAALDLKQNKATSSTGVVIGFTSSLVYNSPSSPGTASVTDNLTGAIIGVVQKVYHNYSVAPTFPAGWVAIGSATYTVSTLNIIYAEWVTGTRVEYWIVK